MQKDKGLGRRRLKRGEREKRRSIERKRWTIRRKKKAKGDG